MEQMETLISEYVALSARQRELEERKQALRKQIMDLLKAHSLTSEQTPSGMATLTKRFTLIPRIDKIISTLTLEDILPFARFTPNKVKQVLVPKYGRAPMLDLFDTETIPMLLVKAPQSLSGRNGSLPTGNGEDGE